MVVSYCLRFFYWRLFYEFGTYSGDIWYVHMNYGEFFRNYIFFRMEYPVGIFILVKFATELTLLITKDLQYEPFLTANALILGAFGLGTTFLLWRIQLTTQGVKWRIWVFWVLAPSFIFYSLLNFDLPAVFLCLLAQAADSRQVLPHPSPSALPLREEDTRFHAILFGCQCLVVARQPPFHAPQL